MRSKHFQFFLWLTIIPPSFQTGPFQSGGIIRILPVTVPVTTAASEPIGPPKASSLKSTSETSSLRNQRGPFQSGGILSVKNDTPIEQFPRPIYKPITFMRPTTDDVVQSLTRFAENTKSSEDFSSPSVDEEEFIKLEPKEPDFFAGGDYVSMKFGSNHGEEIGKADRDTQDTPFDSWLRNWGPGKSSKDDLEWNREGGLENQQKLLGNTDNSASSELEEDQPSDIQSFDRQPGKMSILSVQRPTSTQVSRNSDVIPENRDSEIRTTQAAILPRYVQPQKILLPRHESQWNSLPREYKTRILLLRHEQMLKRQKLEKLKRCNKSPDFAPCIPRNEANNRALKCCTENASVKQGCYSLCSLDLQLIDVRHLTENNECDGTGFFNFMTCVTEQEDLRECCRAKGVSGACLKFCHPTAGLPQPGVHLWPCLAQFPTVMQCAWSGMEPLP